ncbi:lysophospholipase L1-like esterase [Mizugakiibacter sediminis]|uniref:GDSL family lipase n=1 Tax=Mizugakiibacter sediminis TaxID=1475481 RepID=A0A0K8QKF4_9GAMM|nr:arylesterase [Mizugakiibacter sediminis]GAP65314.1 lysophospholipase L1-like esterase [Mizugakiibacter sediminis]
MRRILVVLLLMVASAAALAAPPPVLVLGDSLSAAHNIPADAGWVHLLEVRLREMKAPRPVINASVSGATTADGVTRLPALLQEHRPALVILELGANDGLRGLPLAEIRANLEAMIRVCRAAEVEVLLIGIELPVNYGPRYRGDLRAVYRDLAARYRLPLVPFLLDGVALDPALMQDDGLHPAAAGEPRVLDNVWKVLAPRVARLR